MAQNQLKIIAETNNWVAIDKPSGLLTIPDRAGTEINVKEILLNKYSEIFTVHRLDRDTSGVLIFAKNKETHQLLNDQFENRSTEKFYLGFVNGLVQNDNIIINEPIAEDKYLAGKMTVNRSGKPSVTECTVLERHGNYSYMQFKILTGRTHQIRVHLKHIGHPVLCDTLYGNAQPILLSSFKKKYNLSKNLLEEQPIVNRLMLHANSLSFKDVTGEVVKIEASIPKTFTAFLQQLKKWA